MRLIDADKVLATSFRIEGRWNLADGKMQYFEAIPVRAIENAETVDATQSSGWIPCSERLPRPGQINHNTQDYQQYMCLVEFGEIRDARPLQFDKAGKWVNGSVDMSDRVTAWQPLPEPYKED